MKKALKLFLKKVKELWNVYGGIALSTFIAWLTGWSKIEMDKWTSYLILTLTCISVLTFFKIVFFKKKRKPNIIEKGAIQSQKSFKSLQTALNPQQVGEEVGNAIIYTVKGGRKLMKKVGNFFKELWYNKFTLSNTIIVLFMATLTQVATYTDYLYRFNWFAEHELVVKVASPIVAGIIVFIDLLTTYTKYGFESLEDIAKRKEQKKLAELSKQEKAKLKLKLKDLRDTLEVVKEKRKDLFKTIADMEKLINAGYNLSMRERDIYESDRNQVANIENTISNLEKSIKETEEQL